MKIAFKNYMHQSHYRRTKLSEPIKLDCRTNGLG